jgi:hypothetical protein
MRSMVSMSMQLKNSYSPDRNIMRARSQEPAGVPRS